MKKLALTVLASFVGLQAGFASTTAFVMTKKGRKVKTTSIVSDASGNITYSKGKVKSKIKRSDYKYAWLPYTSTVLRKIDRAFEKKGASQKIADLYVTYSKKYEFVGWDFYCKSQAAICLDKLGKTPKAITILESIKDATIKNELKRPHHEKALSVLASLYTKQGQSEKAASMIPSLVKSSDGDVAGSALVVQGDIFAKKGKKKDAVLSYLQTVLLFPKSNKSRPEALFKAIKNMKQMNDAGRAKAFIDILTRDYPNNEFTNKL